VLTAIESVLATILDTDTAVRSSAEARNLTAPHGDAPRPPLAGVPVSGRGTVGCAASTDTTAADGRGGRGEKGKKRATCPEEGSAAGESREISEGNWLAALDDFRNWLIGEAA